LFNFFKDELLGFNKSEILNEDYEKDLNSIESNLENQSKNYDSQNIDNDNNHKIDLKKLIHEKIDLDENLSLVTSVDNELDNSSTDIVNR
jgi:hypothetical protein